MYSCVGSKKVLLLLYSMKKRLFSLVFMLLWIPLMAQQGDIVLCEGFFNPWLEEGWDVKGDNWAVWYISNTSYAGGKAREMQMYPDYNFVGTTRLVTPIIELDKYDFINFQFNHCLEATQNNFVALIGIGISQNGESWESIWVDTVRGSIAQSQYLLTFDIKEWTAKSQSFCLYFTGDGSYVNNWFIDNIIIYASKKNKYGKMNDADENGFIASLSHVFNIKGPKAGTVTQFSTLKKSKNKYAKIVEGRSRRYRRGH